MAASLPAEELDRVEFGINECLRPDVHDGAQGSGAMGEHGLECTRSAMG
jgi:hypothetical protein